jgi:hypothetical protein
MKDGGPSLLPRTFWECFDAETKQLKAREEKRRFMICIDSLQIIQKQEKYSSTNTQ